MRRRDAQEETLLTTVGMQTLPPYLPFQWPAIFSRSSSVNFSVEYNTKVFALMFRSRANNTVAASALMGCSRRQTHRSTGVGATDNRHCIATTTRTPHLIHTQGCTCAQQASAMQCRPLPQQLGLQFARESYR